ncbi:MULTISPECIES: Fur family transcriptional regulator [unclassified Roseitalea]|uniref:Fur family transcriptional regulator n=1 Tax=unclassified Roseitalea TaxID=2639107 RepID=UPI00273FB642|nr:MULTISPECIES: Fur family transcriptional regulator [unclassified Roseitalea]
MHAKPSEEPRLTRNQALVLDTLSEADGPLSAYAILDLLRENGFRAPLQVYRALDKLVAAGRVHRLESLNAFVACQKPDCRSHATIAFAICDRCGEVREVDDPNLARRLKTIADGLDFALHGSVVELRGLCAGCAAA